MPCTTKPPIRATWKGDWRSAWKDRAPLSQLALSGATALGYLRAGTHDADQALARLRRVWAADGWPAVGFADFESALVREGLRLRRLRAP
jgi:hypothetical protein